MPNVKKIELTREDMAEWLAYDPETGIFIWRKAPGRRIKAGDRAGAMKGVRTSAGDRLYRYITFKGVSTPAARFAWLFVHGEWPESPVLAKDGDNDNLRISNLELARFPTVKEMKDGRRVYKMSKDAQRHYGLKRYYGLTGEQYGAMLIEQRGGCAICGKPETVVMSAGIKPLSVDHCHATGQVRGLLCHNCNHGLGHFMDNPVALRKAADYLEKHAAVPSNVVPLKEPSA